MLIILTLQVDEKKNVGFCFGDIARMKSNKNMSNANAFKRSLLGNGLYIDSLRWAIRQATMGFDFSVPEDKNNKTSQKQ